MSDNARDLTLELKNVVLAVKDVPEWYDLGLQLGLPDGTLATIATHPDFEGHRRMMLSKWLDYDTEASWEKLAVALEIIGKRVIAENIRRRFVRSFPAATKAQVVDDDDAKTRLAMTQTILRKVKSSYSLLLIDVQSSLEERKIKTKTVRKFLLNFFEGECSIPNVPDMDDVFESVTSAKLWRFDHYGPLEELAESYLPEDDSARVKMAEYISQLSAYYATTSIIDHLQASDQDDPDDDGHPISPKRYNRRYRKLTVKVKVDPSVPMEYVEKLWKSLMKEFNIPELTAMIDKIEKGSLFITWLILPHIANKIKATYFKSVDFFRHHNIIDIKLGGLFLYQAGWMEGSTPLFQASFAGNMEGVNTLLHEGNEDINQQNDNAPGQTPLIGASLGCGDIHIVKLLLEKGAIVDALSKGGESALMAASTYSHAEVVKLLLKYKADVNLHHNSGLTAMISACSFGNTDTVTLLLAHGAVVDHCFKANGMSALMYASSSGNTESVKVLLQHGASLDLTDVEGQTALMFATLYGHADTARALLEKGATVDIKNNGGLTPLWYASDKDHPETVKVLLEFGAEVDLPCDGKGLTPLMLASARGYADIARVLLERGATADFQTNDGRTALWYATYKDNPEIVQVLLEFEAEVNLPFDIEDGGTALTVASIKGHTQIVRILLFHGAVVDHQDKHGQTPLHHASIGGHVDTVTVLLESKAKIDLQNEDGWTALFLAAYQDHDKVVKTLLDHVAAINTKSNSGLTALGIAKTLSNQAVCEVIEQYLNQGAMVKPQHTGGQEDSESQGQVGVSGQDSKTKLTEEQRSEVKSVSERLLYRFQRVFLRDLMEKKEHNIGDPSHRITNPPKGRRSILNIFNRPGRRGPTQGQVVGTAPAPEH